MIKLITYHYVQNKNYMNKYCDKFRSSYSKSYYINGIYVNIMFLIKNFILLNLNFINILSFEEKF